MTSFITFSQALQATLLSALFLLIATFIFLFVIRGFRRSKFHGLVADLTIFLALTADALLLRFTHISLQIGTPMTAPAQCVATIPIFVHILLFLLAAAWCCLGFIREVRLRRTEITPSSIREALNNLPSALCLATEDGRPVLTNRKMYALATTITGRNLINADRFWQDLTNFTDQGNVRRATYAGTFAFVLPDGNVWRFTRNTIEAQGVCYIQILSLNTTRLWALSKELEQDNLELDAQQKRLRKLLHNIAQIRQGEEILSYKMWLHDRLGRAILTSRHYLLNSTSTDSSEEVIAMWREIAESLQASVFDAEETSSVAKELTDIAELLGCSIDFDGDFPQYNGLLLAAVREALTNAVRHAGADRLNVCTRREEDEIQVTISDNGKPNVTEIAEGGGLSSLRKKIETHGGRMELCCRNGVILKLTISEKEE